MGRILQSMFCAGALLWPGLAAAPAVAQCRLCDTPTTQRTAPDATDDLRLEIESSVRFDRLVIFGNGEGNATIAPDGGRAAGGAIMNIGPRAMVGTAVIHGQPGRIVRVELPTRIQLYSLGGGTVSFDQVTSDLPSLPRLDAAGRLSFRFGGRIRVTGDVDGDYRGDLPITVEYQ